MRDILLVTIDSLRADHLSCYGYDRETSPRIDSLAESGNLFENAFAHAGVTRVSFPTILCSSYPHMYGGYRQISEQRTLVSEALKDCGYQTAAFHSSPYLSTEFGYDRGFDTFYDSMSDPTFTSRLRQAVKYNLDDEGLLFRLLKWVFDRTEETAGVEVGSAYKSAEYITDRAIEKVSSVDEDPLFLWIHYMDVHHPYLPPEDCQQSLCDSAISHRRSVQLRRKMLEDPDGITETEQQQLIDLYDAEIRYTDREIGRLLDAMERERKDKPVVVVTADHGEEFGDHGGYSHNTVHDEGIHVPLVIDDGRTSGQHDEIVGLLDIAPTIVDYADGNQPETFEGYSLRPLVEEGEWPRTAIIGEWGRSEPGERNFLYRSTAWKYMRWADGSEELYDLEADPDERNNVVGEELPVLSEIRAEIDDHIESLDETDDALKETEMSEKAQERLEMLGYKE